MDRLALFCDDCKYGAFEENEDGVLINGKCHLNPPIPIVVGETIVWDVPATQIYGWCQFVKEPK